MIEKVVEEKDAKKKKAAKGKAKGKKGKGKKEEEEEESDPNKPPELIPKTIRTLFTHLTSYSDIEEFFMSVSEEYVPFINAMINKDREALQYYADFIENGEEVVAELQKKLLDQFQFWEVI